MPLRPGDASFLPQLERFRAVGVDVVSLNVGYGSDSLEDHIRMFAAFRAWIAARPETFSLVGSVAEIDRARAEGKTALVFDIEGMAPLDNGDHGLVQLFYDLGARWMLVAYNRNNAVGGGCHDEDEGLTAHGREVLADMKRTGMVVCCSHTGHRTARDVLDAADNPVIFSHSNPSAVSAHARNIPDDLIRACAATGGVVGINGIGFFLGDNDVRPERIVRHIDHVAQLVGPDHVGVSLDYVFDQEDLVEVLTTRAHTFPDPAAYAGYPHMAPPEVLTDVVAGLMSKGYGDDDLGKILGGNWRRVAQAVWR
jgi:membrane dipeptidase